MSEKSKNAGSVVLDTLQNLQRRAALVQNLLLDRAASLRRLLDPRRDIDAECGHPLEITMNDYLRAYTRGDIASRVVSIWPDECWCESPVVYEVEEEEDTQFEKEWKALEQRLSIYSTLHRADVVSGIGQFGGILLGIGDGRKMEEPVQGIPDNEDFVSVVPSNSKELIYLRVFDQSCATVASLCKDVKSPRYGLPETYNLVYQADTGGSLSLTAHWTRFLHLADNRMCSEIVGEPRLKRVFDRILDLHKIAGGSGEMFWRGGFPGISLEASPEALAGGTAGVEFDLEGTKEQLEAYMNGLQRYLALVGMSAKSLSVQVADPVPHLESQIKLIAIAMGIPWRIFVGSEAAQLASEQDMRAWNRRVARRRNSYLTGQILLPLLRRLICAGILPKPKEIHVEWPDLNTPGDKDRAAVAESRMNAILKYTTSGSEELLPPYYFLTLVLGMSDSEAVSVLRKANLLGEEAGKLFGDADNADGSDDNEDKTGQV